MEDNIIIENYVDQPKRGRGRPVGTVKLNDDERKLRIKASKDKYRLNNKDKCAAACKASYLKKKDN